MLRDQCRVDLLSTCKCSNSPDFTPAIRKFPDSERSIRQKKSGFGNDRCQQILRKKKITSKLHLQNPSFSFFIFHYHPTHSTDHHIFFLFFYCKMLEGLDDFFVFQKADLHPLFTRRPHSSTLWHSQRVNPLAYAAGGMIGSFAG